MDTLWTQLQTGRSLAVIGSFISTPDTWSLLRVPCRASGGRGVVQFLRQLLEREATEPRTVLDAAAGRAHGGLRRRLLGEDERLDPVASIVPLINALAAQSELPLALVFEQAQLADTESLDALQSLVCQPHRLSAGLVVHFSTAPDGAAGRLLDTIRRVEGAGAILGSAVFTADPLPWSGLSEDALIVLRAAAWLPDPLDVGVLSTLLRRTELQVLEALQTAVDRGVPLATDGAGGVNLGGVLRGRLRDGLIPALRLAWQDRLTPDEGEPLAEAPPAFHPEPVPAIRFEHEPEPVDDVEPAPAPEPEPEPEPEAPSLEDELTDLLDEARDAAAANRHDVALSTGRRALALLEGLPDTDQGRLLQGRIRAELGELQWHGALLGDDFTLEAAALQLAQAIELLDDPVHSARARSLLAGVLYDRGHAEDLEAALAQLDAAIAELQSAGHALDAARLLNDQAAVFVRLGDPLRAAGLLRRSREVFHKLGDEPAFLAEVAETDHLLARLALHVDARPGMEEEAQGRALRHARNARSIYESLNMGRERAAVLETEGRLLTLAGSSDEAGQALWSAYQDQETLGDVLGLARTTGALATLLGSERAEDALMLLAESVRLNRAKGSIRGLEYNAEALQQLTGSLPPERRAALSSSVEALERMIAG